MEKQTTIKDIALALRISISTVSRALRDAPDVSDDTKKAVKELAEELEYQPNKLALSLLKKQTNTIGLIIPNLDYVLATMVKGIDEIALEAGYTVMVCQSNESFGREMVNTKRLLESLVDGFIISVSSETSVFEHIKKIQSKKIPLVMFDRVIQNINVPKVRLDNVEGGRIATQHLIDEGYKKIALLAGPEYLNISNERKEGYFEILKQNKIKIDKNLIIYCDFNQEYAYIATKELLSMKNRPDAIFAISDRLALGAMVAIKEMGLKIPEDIKVIGFSNLYTAGLLNPSLTTITQPAYDIGKEAANILFKLIEKRGNQIIPEKSVLNSILVERNSSRN